MLARRHLEGGLGLFAPEQKLALERRLAIREPAAVEQQGIGHRRKSATGDL